MEVNVFLSPKRFLNYSSQMPVNQSFFIGGYLEDHFPEIGQEFKNDICSHFTIKNIDQYRGWHVHCGRTMFGRYVYIRLLENQKLTLCEVNVYNEPTGE